MSVLVFKNEVMILKEHGNQTEFGKIVYSFAAFGNRDTGEHGNFLFWQISKGYFEIIGAKIGNHIPWEPSPLIPNLLFQG